MFLLIMAYNVDKLEVDPGEEKVIEIIGVYFFGLLLCLDSLQQGGDDCPGPLYQVVQVPGGEQDPCLMALVRVDTVLFCIQTTGQVVLAFTREQAS